MLSFRNTGCALVLAAALLPVTVSAGDIYKWQDSDGSWHFSSTPPQVGQEYDSIKMPADSKPLVSMRKIGAEREPEYSFVNNLWGPVELELSVSDDANIVTEPPLPARLVLPARGEQRLLKIMADDPYQGFSYRLAYKTMVGAPLSELPEGVNYYPPFPLGMTFPISQGFDNDTTHSDAPNMYAVDIVMPIGTPVMAARAGRVMEMQDNFHGAAQKKSFLSRSNLIRILHDDGTMAVYAHLQPNSLRVRPGALVGTGQWIANSGNTGYSSGPHLHFVVQLNVGMSLESLPFRFYTPGGGTMTPGQRTIIAGVLPKR